MADHPADNAGLPPTTYGQGDRPARGDYRSARPDYTCEQDWSAYTPAQHALYCRLYERQAGQLEGRACRAFVDAVEQLGSPQFIPRFEELSERLFNATRWQVVAVPGLIPESAFFSLLSQRRFPVTAWIREPHEFDYVVEPDVFHDVFGHVPLLFNPLFADYMQAYGAGGLKAGRLDAAELLTRLYWHTVEFGLIREGGGIRAYGAGILSSAGELRHSVESEAPYRLPFDMKRIMRTRYRIDDYQAAYFVIDSFEQLFAATSEDFAPIYQFVLRLPVIEAGIKLQTE